MLSFLLSQHDLIPSVHGGMQTYCINSILWQRRDQGIRSYGTSRFALSTCICECRLTSCSSYHVRRVEVQPSGCKLSQCHINMRPWAHLGLFDFEIFYPNLETSFFQKYVVYFVASSYHKLTHSLFHTTRYQLLWKIWKKLQMAPCCKNTEHMYTAICNALNS